MNHPQHRVDPAAKGRPILEEADIGSGEKTPAQVETEEMIRQIPPLPPAGRQADEGAASRQGGGPANQSGPASRPAGEKPSQGR